MSVLLTTDELWHFARFYPLGVEPALPEVKQVTIEATVIRADGTKHELGKVSDSKWRPFSLAKRRANKKIEEANAWRP